MPVTLTVEVTAAPGESGMVTSAVFSKTLPVGGVVPGRVPTLTAAQAFCTARDSGLPAPYSSSATATVPVRAPA